LQKQKNTKMVANIKNVAKYQKEMEKLFTKDVKMLKEVVHYWKKKMQKN